MSSIGSAGAGAAEIRVKFDYCLKIALGHLVYETQEPQDTTRAALLQIRLGQSEITKISWRCNTSQDRTKGFTASPVVPLAHSLAPESEKRLANAPSTSPPTDPLDAELVRLIALWPDLPDAGRKLLVTTAETLAGQLRPQKAKRNPGR